MLTVAVVMAVLLSTLIEGCIVLGMSVVGVAIVEVGCDVLATLF